jgi:hypothetical protein
MRVLCCSSASVYIIPFSGSSPAKAASALAPVIIEEAFLAKDWMSGATSMGLRAICKHDKNG